MNNNYIAIIYMYMQYVRFVCVFAYVSMQLEFKKIVIYEDIKL